MGLGEGLRARAADQGLVLGATQVAAVEALAELADSGLDGVYLHGPAGRGKTWLLDGVVACTSQRVQRYHWTEFFTRLDAELGRRPSEPDRLAASLDAVLGDCRLLCFDELQVDDPDDAGLVEHLLLRLAARGTRLVVTSNQAPDELLAHPQWHHWARGLVRRLHRRFRVCHVDDGVDHRAAGGLTTRFATGRLLPAGSSPGPLRKAGLTSGGRALPVVVADDGSLWSSWPRLLGTPTGRQDYLLLCRSTSTIGLAAVPALAGADDASRQRFVVLVDIAHHMDTRLLLVLDGPPDWSSLPPRTASRLQLLAHAPAPAGLGTTE